MQFVCCSEMVMPRFSCLNFFRTNLDMTSFKISDGEDQTKMNIWTLYNSATGESATDTLRNKSCFRIFKYAQLIKI